LALISVIRDGKYLAFAKITDR